MDGRDDIIQKHMLCPKNVGALNDYDVAVSYTDVVCGDCIKLYVKLDKNIIKDFKYRLFGCSTAIAISSIFSEFLLFKNIMEVMDFAGEKLPIKRDDLKDTEKHAYDLVYRGIKKLFDKIKESRSV